MGGGEKSEGRNLGAGEHGTQARRVKAPPKGRSQGAARFRRKKEAGPGGAPGSDRNRGG
jgi:hypothetical protein